VTWLLAWRSRHCDTHQVHTAASAASFDGEPVCTVAALKQPSSPSPTHSYNNNNNNNNRPTFICHWMLKVASSMVTRDHWQQHTSNTFLRTAPSFSFPPFSHSSPLPYSLTQLRGLGQRCKLLQQVWAEPGHQTHFDAFRGKKWSVLEDKFLVFLTDRT